MSLKALLTPVFIAIAASIAALVLLAIFAANEQDKQALASEIAVLKHQEASFSDDLMVLTIDNAWWDMAVEKTMFSEDLGWIDRTIGDTVDDAEFVDGAVILRSDLSVMYAKHSLQSNEAPLDPQALLTSPLRKRLAGLALVGGQRSTAQGLIQMNGRLVAYGASLVQGSDTKQLSFDTSGAHPILIFYSTISASEISEIGSQNAIEDLVFSAGKPTRPGQMALLGTGKHLAGWLGWATKKPGTKMALNMVGPSLLLLGLVVVAMLRFVNRATLMIDGLEQASKSKSAFLASMSHEVRTPLNSILGFSELMSLELFGKIEGEKNKEYLRLIKNSGDHLLTIINDILDISKLEAGKFEIYAEETEPAHVIEESAHMMEPSAHDRNITITQTCEAGTIFSDERIMRQILINILSNAIKFTAQGGSVHISGYYAGDHYRILVADNGIGMSKTDIEVALTTFGQVQDQHAKKQGGTGLGLPLVQRFINLLDGTMSIKSNPGKGTSVTLNFPLKTKAKKL